MSLAPQPIDRASINNKIRYWTERYGRAGTPTSGAAPAAAAAPDLDLAASAASKGGASAAGGVAAAAAGAAARKAAAPPAAPATTQVLVMTDAGQRTVLRAMLKQLGGMEVDVAADAAAAAALAASKAYDLYLLDADIPAAPVAAGSGGAPGTGSAAAAAGALAAQLRAIEAAAGRREAPLVGISSRAAEDVGLVEAGYAAILTRPLQRDAVQSTLRAWLQPAVAGGRVEAAGAAGAAAEVAEGGGGRGSSLRILIVEGAPAPPPQTSSMTPSSPARNAQTPTLNTPTCKDTCNDPTPLHPHPADHWANRKLLESMLRQKGCGPSR
jgi:CheY-like chemotaxis protein